MASRSYQGALFTNAYATTAQANMQPNIRTDPAIMATIGTALLVPEPEDWVENSSLTAWFVIGSCAVCISSIISSVDFWDSSVIVRLPPFVVG